MSEIILYFEAPSYRKFSEMPGLRSSFLGSCFSNRFLDCVNDTIDIAS